MTSDKGGFPVKIYPCTYKDIEAIALETSQARAVFIPKSGGKLQSLYHKGLQREFLYQLEDEHFHLGNYADPFDNSDTSGFDDMFPSIIEDFYPDYPWKGTHIPDHGEVWALPWQAEIQEDALLLSVHSVRFPSVLRKKVYFETDSCLRIEYTAENLSPCPFKFLWAAHPLINIEEGTRLSMPEENDPAIINVRCDSTRMGPFGSRYQWPHTTGPDGSSHDLSVMHPDLGLNDKYYFASPVKVGQFCVTHPGGDCLTMGFPADTVPYLGVWVNENGPIIRQKNIAVEPCTAAMDSLVLAQTYDMDSVLPPFGARSWYLTFDLSRKA